MTQHEPIPDSTQVHVDRLVGAQVGEYRVLARQAEGRFGTLYRAQVIASGKPVTLQALRALREGNDEEARAANAIKCANIAEVIAFGELPDGRRYRVLEPLEGESLEQELQRKGRFEPREAVLALGELANTLQAAHAWMIGHGGLGLTSVLRVGGSLRVIDFGIMLRVKPEEDLKALGALGFSLLIGRELEGAPPPIATSGIPEWVDRVLRELFEGRVPDATAAKRELGELLNTSGLTPALKPTSLPAPTKPRSKLPLALIALLVVGVVGGVLFKNWPDSDVAVTEPELVDEEDVIPEPGEAQPEALPVEPQPVPTGTTPPKPTAKNKIPRAVPSAQALMAEISRLEGQLMKRSKPGDDLDQAMFVLNKQRLRLTGSVSEVDRRDVAKQLAGWKRSYLR